MKFDELYKLEDYFEPMAISVDDKARRRELAEYLTDAFLYFFSVYEVHLMYNSMLEKALYEQLLTDRISDAVSKVTGIDAELSNYIRKLAKEVVNTTYKHANKDNNTQIGQTPQLSNDLITAFDSEESLVHSPLQQPSDSPVSEDDEVEEIIEEEATQDYWLSIHRAHNISLNEANTILNYSEFVAAKERGFTWKTWIAMPDNLVRETHVEAEGQTVKIDEYFQVGNSIMKFPHDWEKDPDPREVINCRCSVEYK